MIPLLPGLRVLDLTTVIYGPLVGQLLGDLGADVIKVEAPEGDLARAIQPRGPQGDSAVFVGNNRNKRSMVLDLKTDRQAGRLLIQQWTWLDGQESAERKLRIEAELERD